MKILIFLLVFIPTLGWTQTYHYRSKEFYLNRIKNHFDDPFQYEKDILDLAKVHTFKKLTVINSFNNGKKKFTTVYTFNDQFLVSAVQFRNAALKVSYINDTLISSIERTGKKARMTTYSYQGSNKVLEETFADNQLITRTVIQYDANNNITFSSVGSKKTYSMLYEYDQNKLTHQRFMKNQKILKEWNYECKPEGEVVDEKNLSTICNYSEEAKDGSYIQYTRKEVKGKVFLYKNYYSQDSVCYLRQTFENETTLVNESTIENNVSTYTSFTSNGKIESRYITQLDDQKRIVQHTYYYNNKLKNPTIIRYTYNSNGLLIKKTVERKNKIASETSYTFS